MAHLREMIGRLPQLYRDGELVGGTLGAPATQLEIFDEDLLEVQRSHFFNATLERDEAARLAAILDIALEPWQSLAEYRAWVHALRNARLLYGSVTVEAITQFVVEYSNAFQSPESMRTMAPLSMDPDAWIRVPAPLGSSQPTDLGNLQRRALNQGKPIFLENPPTRRFERIPVAGGVEPLHQFSVQQRGLDDALGGFLLVGLPGDPECTPVIVNLTTGQGLIYLDTIETGKRLWIRPTPDGGAVADLEGTDVTGRLRSVFGLVPGSAWSLNQVDESPKAMRMVRGENRMWFLPIAHYDSPGLDRYLLALADLLLKQGRYDETTFNHALFYQSAAAILRMSWVETRPASFEIQLPAAAMLSPRSAGDQQGRRARALEDRQQLLDSLGQGIGKLRGAGIDSQVRMLPHAEVQCQRDRLVMALPMTIREEGTTGADKLVDPGGSFDITDYEQSIFR